ncbi:MAG: exodeoxyribonuclease VII large subunit [Firmicutes bacterium]|nr:exodeoxyribonuclease VII large subunit [Bacillota bacterium]
MQGQQRILTVSQVNAYVKRILSQDVLLSRVQITGEISNFRRHSSGHLYFALKDAGAAVSAVMFASDTVTLRFLPRDGIRVIVSGSVSLYEKTGQYQLYVHSMVPDGVGALYQAFEELKNKLQQEGLFDESRKRPLPAFPRKVGLVTSPTGAAVQDMIRVTKRRNPGIQLVLIPVLVQGEAAAASIVAGIQTAQKSGADVLIVGRGGGSIEDLWPFNEESVARAIAASEIPVISAVGHETDFTIADFAADTRAATPSMAAELAVPVAAEVLASVDTLLRRMNLAISGRIRTARQALDAIAARPFYRRPQDLLVTRRQDIDIADTALRNALRRQLDTRRHELDKALLHFRYLDPEEPLSRGYSIVYTTNGEMVSSTADVSLQDLYKIRLSDGEMLARAEGVRKKEKVYGRDDV